MAKRPAETGWDSDDLLDEESAGIYAFPLDKEDEEDLDEDALLASDGEDLEPTEQFQEHDEHYEEPTLEIMAEGDDLLEEEDVQGPDFHETEEVTLVTDYQQVEELEEEPAQAEAHVSDSESEEEEDDQKTRGRFKSERSNIVTTQAPRARTDIPETLEISQTDQAEINKFMDKKDDKRSKQRGGMRPQGRGQYRPTYRPHQQQQNQHRPRALLQHHRGQPRFGPRGMMNIREPNMRMQHQQFGNRGGPLFNQNPMPQFQVQVRNNMQQFQGSPMQQLRPPPSILELTSAILTNTTAPVLMLPQQKVHLNPRFQQNSGPPPAVRGEVRMAWEPHQSAPGSQPRAFIAPGQSGPRGPQAPSGHPPRLAYDQQHFQQQGPPPNWNSPSPRELVSHPRPLLGNHPFPNDQDQRHQPNVGLRQPFNSPPGRNAPTHPTPSFHGSNINGPYSVGEDQDYRHNRSGPPPPMSSHHGSVPLLSAPPPINSHNVPPLFSHGQHQEPRNDFLPLREPDNFNQPATQPRDHGFLQPTRQQHQRQQNFQGQQYNHNVNPNFSQGMETEGLPIQTVVGNKRPATTMPLTQLPTQGHLEGHLPVGEHPRPFPGQGPRKKQRPQQQRELNFNQQTKHALQQQQPLQQHLQSPAALLKSQVPKPQQQKPLITADEIEHQKRLQERAARFSQPPKRLSVESNEATPAKVAKTVVTTLSTTKTVVSLKPKASPVTTTAAQPEPTEEEYEREVQIALEKQKTLREQILQRKEQRRQNIANQRRSQLEQKLSQKGMSIKDIAGSGDGSAANAPAQQQQQGVVASVQPTQPQKQQITTVGQGATNSAVKYIIKKVKIKRADGRIEFKQIKLLEGQVIKGGKIIPVGQVQGQAQHQSGQRVVHIGGQPKDVDQGNGQTASQARGRGQHQGRGQAQQGRGLAQGRGQAPQGRGNVPQGRGQTQQNRGQPQLGRGQPQGRGQNVQINQDQASTIQPIQTRGSVSRARGRGRGLNHQTSANQPLQVVRQVSTSRRQSQERKDLIWGCPGMDPHAPVKKVVRPGSTGSGQEGEKKPGQSHRIVLQGVALTQARTVNVSNPNNSNVVGAQAASDKQRRVVMTGAGDAPVMSNPIAIIDGLATSTSEKAVRDLAKKVGALASLAMDRNPMRAYLQFQDPSHTQVFATKYNRTMMGLAVIRVSLEYS